MKIYILNATSLGKVVSEVLCNNIKVSGIITLNKSVGYEKTAEYFDYSEFCIAHNLEYIDVSTYGMSAEDDKRKIKKLEIDLLVVASWQRLLPEWLILQCSIGVIGAHGSADGITNGRGRSPQNWALILGRREFFISIFWIRVGIDNGEVIDTCSFMLENTDDILISYIKVNILVAKMIINNLGNGNIDQKYGLPQPQQGYYLPKRNWQDGKIDWNRTSYEIYNFVRALTKPYPGAYTIYNDGIYPIWNAAPIDIQYGFEGSKNGEVVCMMEEGILVKCGKGLVFVREHFDKKKIKTGVVFESADYYKQIESIISRHEKKYHTPISHMVLDEIKGLVQ